MLYVFPGEVYRGEKRESWKWNSLGGRTKQTKCTDEGVGTGRKCMGSWKFRPSLALATIKIRVKKTQN